jgi:DNA-binding NtrC family response regulator
MLLRRRKVVVVEDDPLQRVALADLVIIEGLAVIECANAESAALALDQFGSEIDLLITDVNLGSGMSGTELATLAQHKLPGVSIIVISGEAAPPLAPEMIFLSKPVATWELRNVVRRKCSAEAGVDPMRKCCSSNEKR